MQNREQGNLSIGDPIITPGITTFVEGRIGSISSIRKVSGGLVHHVYKVLGRDSSYYLKVRGSTYSALPSLTMDPKEIANEAKALQVFSSAVPDVFPHVVGFDEAQSALLMTDVNPSERTLISAFDSDSATPEVIARMGSTLGRVHKRLAQVTNPIREDGDQEQYETNLRYSMLRFNDPILNDAVDQLRKLPRQLIVGDISPKNVGINDNGITFFDLEYASMGNPIFEVGYALGHIILHTAHRPQDSNAFIEAFLDGYQREGTGLNLNDPLLRKITAATILYRLQNEVIPYKTPLSEQQKQALIQTARQMLKFTTEPQDDTIRAYDQARRRTHPAS